MLALIYQLMYLLLEYRTKFIKLMHITIFDKILLLLGNFLFYL